MAATPFGVTRCGGHNRWCRSSLARPPATCFDAFGIAEASLVVERRAKTHGQRATSMDHDRPVIERRAKTYGQRTASMHEDRL